MSSEASALVAGAPLYGGDNTVGDARVPFVIEGELVQIERGHAGNILEPSADRVAPRCIHFGTCGGCQYQHMSTAREHATKLAVHRAVLQASGLRNVPSATLHAADAWAYRNRVRMRVHEGHIGYSRRASNEFLAITECPIASPLLWQVAATLQQLAAWPDGIDEFEIFVNSDETAAQISFFLDAQIHTMSREAPAQFRRLCDAAKQHVPQIAGAGLLVHADVPASTRKRIRENTFAEVAKWGSPEIAYTVEGTSYTVTRGAFFQVNRFVTDRMVHLVTADRAGTLAFDLFAGAGLFSIPLTRSFREVVAVEIGEPSASDLRRALAAQGSQHTVHHSTTLDFLRRNRRTPDLVVMDPPRAGLGRDVARALGALAAPVLVYVSCDPTTFATDARGLLQSGYTVEHMHLLDMFPQTFHMETVAVFRKGG